jgi:hypothetical protein
MSGTVMPAPKLQFFDNNGAVLAGGKLYSFASGTTTPQATYSDADLAVGHENANPVVLDSAGRATVFLSPTTYKFVLKTSADATVWTVDGVAAVPPFNVNLDVEATAGEAISANEVVYLSDGSVGTAGRWYKTDADAVATSTGAQMIAVAPAAIASGAAGSVRLQGRVTDLSGLTAGTVYYISGTAGALTATAPSNARVVGVADSTTSLIIGSGVTQSNSVRRLYLKSSATGNSGAGEDTLGEYPVAANTLANDGQTLAVLAYGTTAATNVAKVIKAYFGAGVLTAYSDTNSSAGEWILTFFVMRLGASSQQLLLSGVGNGGALAMTAHDAGTASETLSGAVTLKVTGTATNDNDIVLKGLIINLIP